jgi:cytidylate kinase
MPRRIYELVNEQVLRSELATRRAEADGKPGVRPVVTISRSMGSGARIIAQKLASNLGWSLWDKNLIDAMQRDSSVSRRVVEEFDERFHSEFEVTIRNLLGDHEIGDFLYPRHLIKAVLGISKLGNAIILGRGANFILPNALNVRIDAPEDLRIHNMMIYENLTEEEAREKIHESDRDRAHFLRKTFGKETAGHCVYHLSLCMCAFTNDGAAEIINQAIKARFGVQLKER